METSSGEFSSRKPHDGADLAALIGATIAVLFTLTSTPGAWGPLSTIIGLVLIIVLLAFFWNRRPSMDRREHTAERGEDRKTWVFALVGLALSIVMAYVAAIASAQAVQNIWFTNNSAGFECRSVAVEQSVTAVHDLSDSSSGATTLRQLVGDTLQNGHPSGPYTVYGSLEDRALKIGFYDEYDDALGGCLADEAFGSLWWVGVPVLLLTLVWWNWAYIGIFRRGRQKAVPTPPG